MRMVRQLGREDWLQAGLAALARAGEPGLRVEAVARIMGVTKGSFYWHFRDRAAWRDAILALWEQRAFADLAVAAPSGGGRAYGGQAGADWGAVERALRAWAQHEVAVAQSLSRVLRERAAQASAGGAAGKTAV